MATPFPIRWLAILSVSFLALFLIYSYTRYPDQKPRSIESPTPSIFPAPTQGSEFINQTPFSLQGLAGFRISVFAKDLGPARMMVFDERSGALFVSITKEGKVLGLQDADQDGVAEQRWEVIDGLQNPHGLAIREGFLYIAEEHQVGRVRLFAERNYEVIIPNLPAGAGHFTRTIGFGPDPSNPSGQVAKLYLSIGSSCNVCFEKDERRGTIMRFNPDGSDGQIFARGLRNAVGFTWQPLIGKLWATDNGRDLLGDDLPPEEINIINEADPSTGLGARNYGWPICYGNKIHDTDFDKRVYVRDPCADTESPVVELPAHTAPLGLRFDKEGNLFVALHGSWNRTYPVGYKVIKISFQDGKPKVSDFIWGWISEEAARKPLGRAASQFASGRPVDIIFDDQGVMYISDDKAGMIYRVSQVVQTQ